MGEPGFGFYSWQGTYADNGAPAPYRFATRKGLDWCSTPLCPVPTEKKDTAEFHCTGVFEVIRPGVSPCLLVISGGFAVPRSPLGALNGRRGA